MYINLCTLSKKSMKSTKTIKSAKLSLNLNNSNKKFKVSFLSVFATFLLFSANSQNNAWAVDASSNNLSDAPDITVTAQKLPVALKDTTQNTTIYQINSDSNSYDALRDIPSLGATSSTYGSQTSMFIRGGASNHNLVLLNGVPINQLSSGIAAIERLPFKQFKQLEVVRGNVSALYGSAAMAGVLNFTQKKSQKPTTIDANLGLGSHGSRYANAKLGQYLKDEDGYFAYDVSLNHEDRHQQSTMNAEKKFNVNPDRDGIRQNTAAANFYYKKNRYQAELHALFQDDKIDYDKEVYTITYMPDLIGGYSKQYSKGRLGYYHLTQQLQLAPQFLLKMDNALVQDNTREYQQYNKNSPQMQGDTLKQRTLFNALELRYQPNENNTFVTQAETNFQKLDANSYGYPKYKFTQRNTKSGRLAYLYNDQTNRLDANFRRDWVNEGNKSIQANSYYLAAARYFTPELQAGLIHSQAFKTPSFNELYGQWGNNPNLQAEKSKNYEAFVRYGLGAFVMRTSAYQTKYKDLIAYDAMYKPQNINRATAQGFEQSITWQQKNWQGGLFANYQHIRDETSKKPMLRRPHLMTRLNLAVETNVAHTPVKFGGDIYYRGKSKDYVGYSVGKLPAYVTMGLFAEANINKNVSTRFSINNLFDKKAEEVSGYPINGRNFMFDLSYKY